LVTTSTNVNRFLKFFHAQFQPQEEILYLGLDVI